MTSDSDDDNDDDDRHAFAAPPLVGFAGQINTTNCQADKRLSIYQPLSWIAIPQTKQPNLFLSLNIPTSFLDCITTDETNQALLQPDVTFGYSARMHAAYYAVHST